MQMPLLVAVKKSNEMRTIVIEDAIFKVSEKEFKKLNAMQEVIKKENFSVEQTTLNQEIEKLCDYLDLKKDTYKFIGYVDFDWRV